MSRLRPVYGLRPNKTCDSVFLDSFLWKDYYKVKCAVSEDRAALWLMEKDGILSSAMPLCKEEDLPHFFYQMVDYFDNVLHKPFYISLADAEAVEYLDLDPKKFEVTELDDLKDYLYDGNAMRTLAGKKLHKKKNHVNGYMKAYGEDSRTLNGEIIPQVLDPHNDWFKLREFENYPSLLAESDVVCSVLRNWDALPGLIGGALYVGG